MRPHVLDRLRPAMDWLKRRGDAIRVVSGVLLVALGASLTAPIATNLFMLGYAWQKGLVPLSLQALEREARVAGDLQALDLVEPRLDAVGRERGGAPRILEHRGVALGRQARLDLNEYFGRKVHLELWVKVKEGWSDDENAMRKFGYET